MWAVSELLTAHRYAHATRQTAWDFAIGVQEFRGQGLMDNDLRLLHCLGMVEHAMEVTMLGEKGRTATELYCIIDVLAQLGHEREI